MGQTQEHARPNAVRFPRLRAGFHRGLIDIVTVRQSVQAWIGHAGDTWRLREQIFEAFPFLAGDHRPK